MGVACFFRVPEIACRPGPGRNMQAPEPRTRVCEPRSSSISGAGRMAGAPAGCRQGGRGWAGAWVGKAKGEAGEGNGNQGPMRGAGLSLRSLPPFPKIFTSCLLK